MKKRNLSLLLLLLIGCIFFLNLFADYHDLYYHLRWFDIPMHILGGFWISCATLFLYFTTTLIERKNHTTIFISILTASSVLTIGLGWEIYEYFVDKTFAVNGLQLGDSLKDLVNDLIGGLLGALFFIKKGYNKGL